MAELSAVSFWGGIAVGLVLALVAQILVRVFLPLPGTADRTSQPEPDKPVVDDVPPEILPVIACAVHAVLAGRPHKIHSIAPSAGTEYVGISQQAWSVEGRRQIFQSHRIR